MISSLCTTDGMQAGDTVYGRTTSRYRDRPSYWTGKVTKRTPSGQVVVKVPYETEGGTVSHYEVRFNRDCREMGTGRMYRSEWSYLYSRENWESMRAETAEEDRAAERVRDYRNVLAAVYGARPASCQGTDEIGVKNKEFLVKSIKALLELAEAL